MSAVARFTKPFGLSGSQHEGVLTTGGGETGGVTGQGVGVIGGGVTGGGMTGGHITGTG